jgi:hypothetical protein
MANVVQVDVDFFGKDLSVDDFAKEARIWAKENLGKIEPLSCPCINKDIHFSNKGIRHTIEHKKHNKADSYEKEIISVLSVMPELLNNCEHRYTTQDNKGRDNILSIIKLVGKVKILGKEKKVEIILREVPHEESTKIIFYNHTFTE